MAESGIHLPKKSVQNGEKELHRRRKKKHFKKYKKKRNFSASVRMFMQVVCKRMHAIVCACACEHEGKSENEI